MGAGNGAGSVPTSAVSASTPPAEAPITTSGDLTTISDMAYLLLSPHTGGKPGQGRAHQGGHARTWTPPQQTVPTGAPPAKYSSPSGTPADTPIIPDCAAWSVGTSAPDRIR